MIYDNFVHDMQPNDISMARDIKYNTIRSILKNFYQNGRVNVKKKKSGYLKGQPKSKQSLPKDIPTAAIVPAEQMQPIYGPDGKINKRRKTNRPYRRFFA